MFFQQTPHFLKLASVRFSGLQLMYSADSGNGYLAQKLKTWSSEEGLWIWWG